MRVSQTPTNHKCIAVIGAQCTGKTTLVNELSDILKIPKITEVARRYNIPRAPSIKHVSLQLNILSDQISAEYNTYRTNGSFVSDRSTIDNMAYWLCNAHDYATDDEKESYMTTCIRNVFGNENRYTHVFLVQPEFAIEDDGFREIDPVYQNEIHTIIKTILRIYNIKHYTLTGDLQSRIQQALEILSEDKKWNQHTIKYWKTK